MGLHSQHYNIDNSTAYLGVNGGYVIPNDPKSDFHQYSGNRKRHLECII